MSLNYAISNKEQPSQISLNEKKEGCLLLHIIDVTNLWRKANRLACGSSQLLFLATF